MPAPRFALLAALVALSTGLAVQAAKAGPWPREAGQRLVILGLDQGRPTLWAEWGLGKERWLVGEMASDRDLSISWHQAWRRLGDWQTAWALGVRVQGSRPVPRGGVSLGRGISTPRAGWMTADLAVVLHPAAPEAKLDLTLGYHLHPRLMAISQLQGAWIRGKAPDLHLAGALVWQLNPRFRIEGAARHDLHNFRTTAKIALWAEF